MNDVNGSELRAWREKRGLSQSSLARMLGVDHNNVWRWESGRHKVLPGRLMDLVLAGLDEEIKAGLHGEELSRNTKTTEP